MFKSFEPRVIPVGIADEYHDVNTYHLLLQITSDDNREWILTASFMYQDDSGVHIKAKNVECEDIEFLQTLIDVFTPEAAKKFVMDHLPE